MKYNFGNTATSSPQSWNWLEDKRSKDNKMSGKM